MNMYAKFQLHPPYGFWGEDFWIFFSKIFPLYGNQSNSAIWTKFIWIVEEHFCKLLSKYLQWDSSKCQFFHYKSMATISCRSNHSSYPIRTKTILFVPPAYRCYMWKNRLHGFRGDVVWKSWRWTTTTDVCLYDKLTYEPSAQVG